MDPPPPKLDPPLPASNVIMRVVTGMKLLNTFQRITLLSELKETPVFPSKLVETPMTIMTFTYEKSINHGLALATTFVFKKAIEAEIKSGTYELGLVGLLDHNISYHATSKKECAIYFNSIVDESFIKCTLNVLLTALRESHIAQEYGFEPPKRYQYQLFMIPYMLGFLREEVEQGLFLFEPKHLKILQNKSVINSGTNCVGTHGNVILKTEVGGEPLTSVDVSTNRGIFKLCLEQKDFYSSYAAKDNAQPASTEQFSLHKTRLCKHHASGKRCFSGSNCLYAHGSHELRPKVGGFKRGFTHGPANNDTDPDFMSTDEVQSKECIIIDHRKQSAVCVPEVDNPILGFFVPGSLGESVNSSSSVAIAPVVAINAVECLNGGKVSVPETVITSLVPESLGESVNSSSSVAIAPVVAINNVESVNGGKLSIPDMVITTDAFVGTDGVNSSATNSAVNGVDDNPIILGDAMDLGDFVEKNAASTLVRDINTSTDSSVATPAVVKLTKSQKKRVKRAATSPPEGAIIKSSATDVVADVTDYDTAFPTSPLSAILKTKIASKGKGNTAATPATTGPAFSLNGKAVPTTASSGGFDYAVAKPPLATSARPKRDGWMHVGNLSVPITHISPGHKGPNVAGGGVPTTATSSNIGDGSSTSKGSRSPSTASVMKSINNAQQSSSSSSKQLKPAGANFNRQTSNKFQALSDSADCGEVLSAQ